MHGRPDRLRRQLFAVVPLGVDFVANAIGQLADDAAQVTSDEFCTVQTSLRWSSSTLKSESLRGCS